MKKGQFSIEFIIVLGVLLTLIASISLPLYESSSTKARRLTKLTQAREAANKLAGALNTVYAGGIGARQTVEYSLPQSVEQIQVGVSVPPDNRAGVKIGMSWENIVLVKTLLPTDNHKNWEGYPNIEVINGSLSTDSSDYTVTVEYKPPDDTHDNLWIEIEEA